MKKNHDNDLTELVFILDCSGSMSGLEADTIGGFNAMIRRQKQEPGRALVSTILFDDKIRVLHDRVPIQKVKPMTDRQYRIGGCTALLDAVGGAIHHIGSIYKYARPEDVPAHTMFVITTDGMENASRQYRLDEVKQMIRREQEQYGWEFLFLGANIDAVQAAGHLGIRPSRAVNYCHDGKGTRLNYETVSQVVSDFRADCPVSANWKAPIEEDFNRRSKPEKGFWPFRR